MITPFLPVYFFGSVFFCLVGWLVAWGFFVCFVLFPFFFTLFAFPLSHPSILGITIVIITS
jgi:hypothetical protein